jgi:hypothetical protein
VWVKSGTEVLFRLWNSWSGQQNPVLDVSRESQQEWFRISRRFSLQKDMGMYFVAGLLVILSGLFYAADHGQLGKIGSQMCLYGDAFCRQPVYVLIGAGIAAAWGAFVSIK